MECHWYCIISVLVTLLLIFLITKLLSFVQRPKTPALRRDFPKEKVLLHQFGKGKYAPSMSPFPMKLETYMRMAGIPYENALNSAMSSKGKIPWIEYNGKAIDDSQFCLEFLNKERGVDLNKNLTDEQRGAARALQKMVEENLYWSIVWYRWDEEGAKNFNELSGNRIPKLMLRFVGGKLKNQLYNHGFGRHSKEEKLEITRRDVEALSMYLGSKKFMMGDEATEVDCALFGMLAQLLWQMPGSPHEQMMNNDFKNLKEYCYRMKEEYWPDWNDCIFSTTPETDFEK